MHGTVIILKKKSEQYDYKYYADEIFENYAGYFDYVSDFDTNETDSEEKERVDEFFDYLESLGLKTDRDKKTFIVDLSTAQSRLFESENMPVRKLMKKLDFYRYEYPALECGYGLRLSFIEWLFSVAVHETEYELTQVFDFHY